MTVVRAVADSVFEWDSFKDKSNLAKHGISFEEAIDVFFDAAAISGDALWMTRTGHSLSDAAATSTSLS